MKKVKIKSKEKESIEVDYPRLDLEKVLPILKKIDDAGGIVTRSQLADLCGVKAGGGGFSHIVFALKLYGVVDKEGQSDFKINDIGRGLIKGDKTSTMQALSRIAIFKDLFSRYSGNIPKKTVIKGYLTDRYNIEKNTANTIASRFIKNVKFLNTLSGEISLPKALPPSGEPKTDFATYKTLVDVSAALKTGNIKNVEETLIKLKGIKLPSISGNELLENFDRIENIKDENKRMEALGIILELIIQSYNK